MNSIELTNINKNHGKRQVLCDVSLQVEQGSIYGILGPSGCGKTTTVKIMAGILNPDSGEVKVMGKAMPHFDIMGKIGYMAQAAALYHELSAEENLNFFGKLYGLRGKSLKERIEHVTAIVNLKEELSKSVGDYSGGMMQRLSLAIALLAEPDVLILDEPTVGIDPVLRVEIWAELNKLAASGVTILITTHVMDEAVRCNKLAMIRGGRVIAAGTPEELMKKSATSSIEEAFIYFGGGNDAD